MIIINDDDGVGCGDDYDNDDGVGCGDHYDGDSSCCDDDDVMIPQGPTLSPIPLNPHPCAPTHICLFGRPAM